jgi:hypothetical protein
MHVGCLSFCGRVHVPLTNRYADKMCAVDISVGVSRRLYAARLGTSGVPTAAAAAGACSAGGGGPAQKCQGQNMHVCLPRSVSLWLYNHMCPCCTARHKWTFYSGSPGCYNTHLLRGHVCCSCRPTQCPQQPFQQWQLTRLVISSKAAANAHPWPPSRGSSDNRAGPTPHPLTPNPHLSDRGWQLRNTLQQWP